MFPDRDRRARTGDEIDTGGKLDEVTATCEAARLLLPRPGARRFGDDPACNASEVLETRNGSRHQERGRQAPSASHVDGPGHHDAQLHEHHRDPVEHRLDPMFPNRCVDASAVDPTQVVVHGRRRSGQLDGADRVEGRDERATEVGASGRRGGGRATSRGRSQRRHQRRHHHDAEQHCPREPGAAEHGGDCDDDQTVGEVDPSVGVVHVAIRVHCSCDGLARRCRRESALIGLAHEHRGPDSKHHRNPPERIPADGFGERDRRNGESGDERDDEQGDRFVVLESDDDDAPEPTGDRPVRPHE